MANEFKENPDRMNYQVGLAMIEETELSVLEEIAKFQEQLNSFVKTIDANISNPESCPELYNYVSKTQEKLEEYQQKYQQIIKEAYINLEEIAMLERQEN